MKFGFESLMTPEAHTRADAGEVERYLVRAQAAEREGGYFFFPYREDREELAAYCEEITCYLHDKGIPNLVIIDRSSRPLYIGVREYWLNKYPKEKLPGIYFMNPKGFKSKDDLSDVELWEIAMDCAWKGDIDEDPMRARSKDEIIGELESTYTALVKDKDKPLLVFDSCIHTGDTLSPVVDTLDEAGFKNVLVGTIGLPDQESTVRADFIITYDEPSKGCYPFDRDQMIEKVFNHVYSKPNTDPNMVARSIVLREEIKKNYQRIDR